MANTTPFSRGLIPGPKESADAFAKRVQESVSVADPEMWREANAITQRLFHFSVDWVEVTYSNHDLRLWEGAAIWTDKRPRIQLREMFRRGKFWIYTREELLAHEAVHAARLRFKEPIFEEIIAYQTAQSRFRRYWGPLFRRPWEAIVGIAMIVAPSWIQIFVAPPVGWIGVISFLYYANRLICSQATFRRCAAKVSLPAALCLTDHEIRRFSKMSLEEIRHYLEQDDSARGQMLLPLLSLMGRR